MTKTDYPVCGGCGKSAVTVNHLGELVVGACPSCLGDVVSASTTTDYVTREQATRAQAIIDRLVPQDMYPTVDPRPWFNRDYPDYQESKAHTDVVD